MSQFTQSNDKKRQRLVPRGVFETATEKLMSAAFKGVETKHGTIDDLKANLQTALELEHSTIPAYLTALYSIKEGTNLMPVEIIKSVVIEEMLHMVMVANLINAIGSTPKIGKKETVDGQFVPSYPTGLPGNVDKELVVGLDAFSRETIRTFWKIEHPDDTYKLPKKYSERSSYPSIGAFYKAIKEDMIALEREAKLKKSTIFTGTTQQVSADNYYGSGGRIIPVRDLDSALEVIEEIVGQGEGSLGSIFSEPYNAENDYMMFGEDVEEYAHYFRFKEVFFGRFYDVADSAHRDSPNKGLPTGERFDVDWDAVYNMKPNPKMADYPKDSAVYQKMLDFNRTYSALLDNINAACNGQPEMLRQGIQLMYDLKYKAIELMKIPLGNGQTAGPSFEYVDSSSKV